MRFTIPIAVSFLGASVRPSEIIAPGTHSDVAPALVPARTGSHVEDGQLTSRADSQMILEFWKTAPLAIQSRERGPERYTYASQQLYELTFTQ